MFTSIYDVQKKLRSSGNKKTASQLQKFFKTGKGEYGEDDIFLGIRVPKLRKYIKECNNISIAEISTLLTSAYHEERMFSLLMLVDRFSNGNVKEKKTIYETYIKHTGWINSWDLVDCSAEHIAGAYLKNRDKQPLYKLASSTLLWDRRIAIISTFHFIKHNEYKDSLKISEILKHDSEDLIHKAVGWMLREIGKRDLTAEENFLKKHYKNMPRTMLRYAIEKFDEEKRQAYLKGKI